MRASRAIALAAAILASTLATRPAEAAEPAPATPAAATPAAGGSCPASTASNDAKSSVAPNASKYVGTTSPLVGNGECAVFVESVTGVGLTTSWTKGASVQANCSSIPVGTVVATFNGSDGGYNVNPPHGNQHTGLFQGCTASGMTITDQWSTGSGVTTHTIPWSAWGSNAAEGGSKFYVVDSPTGKGNTSNAPAAGGGGGTPAAGGTCQPTPSPAPAPSTDPAKASTTPAPAGQANPQQQPPAGQAVPAAGATGNATLVVGDPSFCWLCDASVEAMGVLEAMATKAVPTVAADFWPLAVSLMMFALAYRMLSHVVTGRNALDGVAGIMFRLAVAGALVGAGVATEGASPTATGSATVGQVDGSAPSDTSGSAGPYAAADGVTGTGAASGDNVVTDWVLSPPITLGSAVGADLAAVAAPAVGVTAPQTSNCQYAQPSSSGVSALADAAKSLVGLVCYVHAAGNYGVAAGGALVTSKLGATTLLDDLAALAFVVAGLLMCYVSLISMLTFGGAVIEALLKLAIAVCFFPLYAALAVFDLTRPMATQALRGLLFTFAFLAMTGLGAVVALFVAAKSMALGIGQSSGSLDVVAISTQAQAVMAGLDVTKTASYGTLAKFLGFDAVGFLMAGRILKGTQSLAAQLTGHHGGAPGAMAAAPAATIRRIGQVATGAAALGGTVAARFAARAAGTVLREAGNLAGHAAVSAMRRL